jgi:predicted transcriptional regulator
MPTPLHPDMRARLDDLARRLDRPRARLVREAIAELLAKYDRKAVMQ